MRFMLTFRVLMDEGNAGIKDGSLGQTLETISLPNSCYRRTSLPRVGRDDSNESRVYSR
jgi:hypothetical protein